VFPTRRTGAEARAFARLRVDIPVTKTEPGPRAFSCPDKTSEPLPYIKSTLNWLAAEFEIYSDGNTIKFEQQPAPIIFG
jgi:hypothetical protein